MTTIRTMNGQELKAWRQKWQLTQEALAGLLGVHRVTIAKWEGETRSIPPFLHLALEALEYRRLKEEGSHGLAGRVSEVQEEE